METAVLILGILLMGTGLTLVVGGIISEIGPFQAPRHLLALVLVGLGLLVLGQWMID